MARTGKLAAAAIAKAKGPAVLHDGGGLYLRVAATGAKSWVYRYTLGGQRHDMGIGPYPLYSLAEAREKAQQHRKRRREGIDPLEHRRAERAAQRLLEARNKTFRDVAEEYINSNEAGWRNAKHKGQWRTTLEVYVYPKIGELPVGAIDTGLVVQVLKPIWTLKPETANRVRGRIELILNAAKTHGYREGENPARWRGHLENLLPKKTKLRRVEHLAALPYLAIPNLFVALRKRDSLGARVLEFTILTAARTGEVMGATWAEIDLAAKVWRIPAERMKGNREHRVPLSAAAVAVIVAVQPLAAGALVFPGRRRGGQLSNRTMRSVLQKMGYGAVTVHGFRSSFRDWAAERTAYPREVVETALAHVIESKTEAAYRRSDLFERRRRLMDDWARFCSAPVITGEVVRFGTNR